MLNILANIVVAEVGNRSKEFGGRPHLSGLKAGRVGPQLLCLEAGGLSPDVSGLAAGVVQPQSLIFSWSGQSMHIVPLAAG